MYPVFIYTLNDPTTGIVRYCGQTENPDRRLIEHLSIARSKKYHCACWVKSLLSKKLRPVMEILDVVPDDEADFWEREYIQNFRERGFDLTNFSDGGRVPMRGKKHRPESRAKISKSLLGNKYHLGKKGYKHLPEHGAKLSVRNLGNKYNLGKKRLPETLAKMSVSMRGKNLGKKPSPETRAKMSASQKRRQEKKKICLEKI